MGATSTTCERRLLLLAKAVIKVGNLTARLHHNEAVMHTVYV